VEGSYENGKEPSGSVRGVEFLESLSDYQLLKRTLLYGIRGKIVP
jgi:hypothetical protein